MSIKCTIFPTFSVQKLGVRIIRENRTINFYFPQSHASLPIQDGMTES